MILDRLAGVELHVGELLDESSASGTDLSRWWDDPVGFWERAGRMHEDYQQEVLRSVFSEADGRFSVWRGAHSVGKEYTGGSAIVFGAYVRGMLVIPVSQTERQVVGQLMREVRAAWRAAVTAHGIGGQLFQGSVRINGEDRVIALTGSASVDALTGWHDPAGVLVIISEGQGERLEDSAYDAAIAIASDSKSRVLAMGNPVRPQGRFYEINQSANWRKFRTSAFDTPNVKAGRVVRPGFPAPTWPEEVEREVGGKDSPYYVSRVLAEFPSVAEDSLVQREWLERAHELHRTLALANGSKLVVGVDPARLGVDATALCVRGGAHVHEFVTWRNADTMMTADRVMATTKDVMGRIQTVREVVVDLPGLGAGVFDRLRETMPRILDSAIPLPFGADPYRKPPRVTAFEGGSRAGQPERFVNRRAEAFWAIRKRLEEGKLALPPSPELDEELLATTVEFTPSGKVAITSKDTIKSRLGRSPDSADALAIAFSTDLPSDRPRGRVF